MRLASLLLLSCSLTVYAAEILPLAGIKPGMRGIGKTVFSGGKIEDFDVEILGVLENIGPKQSLILARLSGGPIERTGVMQGMSGSPVYIDGKLAGAVAMAFPFSKEPIAGIRPIEDMIGASPAAPPVRAKAAFTPENLLAGMPRRGEATFGAGKLIDIATPVSFGGFTRDTVERFAPQLRALGLEPMQGIAGGRIPQKMGDKSALEPGAMISVGLVTGDLNIAADGTVTHIDGDKVYAFGHRFLSVGVTDLPFARSEVLTLLPSVSTSFKISAAKELMGSISQDRNSFIAGELGRRASMVPVRISVARPTGPKQTYSLEMVDDRLLSPFLLQMSVFSAIDATEHTVGAGSFLVKGQIEFTGGADPVKLDNMFTADSNSAMQVALSAAVPLAYVLQGGFDALRIKQVDLEIQSFDEKKQLDIDHVFSGRRQVRPGETIDLTIGLSGENGALTTRKVSFPTPIGITPGPLYFTVSDASTTNLSELRHAITTTPRSTSQLISTVNQLKANTKAYVRVWRPDPAYQVGGEDLPAPPASLAMILGRAQSGYGGLTQGYNSKIAEIEIDGGGAVLSGSKTIQVEIKE